MKLSLTQEKLAKALGLAGRVVSSRSSLPVLSNVLLSAEKNRLKISATNLEIGINYWMGCSVEKEGSVTVPARLFAEFVSSLPAGNLELEAEDFNLKVRSPHYESQINGISAEEFPLIPEIKNKPSLVLASDIFREALQQVVIAASLDEARPVLAGVYMKVEAGNLLLVATDSYRLAEKKVKLAGKKEDTKELTAIVPARSMNELARILAETSGDLKVYIDENQIMFEADDTQLTSRLIEGQYPNYKQIIPEKDETTIVINTEEFNRITKVASLFARESAGSVRLEVKEDGKVNVFSSASQVGENVSSADCEVAGKDNEVSLNSRYLLEALSVIKSDKTEFGISGKINPCVIKPADSEDYLHIIMPLRT